MKKLLTMILIMCTLLMSACSSASPPRNNDSYAPPDYTYLEDGSYYYSSAGHITYNINNLPFNLDVEDKAVPLHDVKFFEVHENHGYTAYLVITFSRENLTDDDIYWITSYDDEKFCKTFDMNVYVDSESNNLDTERLDYMGGIYNDSYMHYAFRTDFYRYSFKDSLFDLQIIVAPSGITESDAVYYYYDHLINEKTYSDTIGTLSDSERFTLKQSGYTGPFEDDSAEAEGTTPSNTENTDVADYSPPEPTRSESPATKPNTQTNTTIEKPTSPQTKPSEAVETTEPTNPNAFGVTSGQREALSAAQRYLIVMPFSHDGLISQLEYEGYTTLDATYAADNCNADWNANALEKAKDYLDIMAFSYKGLIGQLEYEKYTNAQATYAADHCGADWNEQAAKKAASYLEIMTFDRSGLIQQLVFEGFTQEQAEYGATANGL